MLYEEKSCELTLAICGCVQRLSWLHSEQIRLLQTQDPISIPRTNPTASKPPTNKIFFMVIGLEFSYFCLDVRYASKPFAHDYPAKSGSGGALGEAPDRLSASA